MPSSPVECCDERRSSTVTACHGSRRVESPSRVAESPKRFFGQTALGGSDSVTALNLYLTRESTRSRHRKARDDRSNDSGPSITHIHQSRTSVKHRIRRISETNKHSFVFLENITDLNSVLCGLPKHLVAIPATPSPSL